jgi:hypothetical protein
VSSLMLWCGGGWSTVSSSPPLARPKTSRSDVLEEAPRRVPPAYLSMQPWRPAWRPAHSVLFFTYHRGRRPQRKLRKVDIVHWTISEPKVTAD